MCDDVVTLSWNDTLYDSAWMKPAPKPMPWPGRRPVRVLRSVGLSWCRCETLLPAVKLSEPNSATGSNTCEALMPSVPNP